MSEPRLRLDGVSKRFGATEALADVHLHVRRGEVRALLGPNGAGKSTLLHLLAGVHSPDSGSMHVDSTPFAPRGPAQAIAAGVSMIHQELAIAPDLSLAMNIALGDERARGGWIDRRAIALRARNALARLRAPEVDVERPAREFPLALLQQVEIARALSREARVVVFDEPTSSLGREESAVLYARIRELAAQQVAIVVVTHFLEDLTQFADTYSVLRDGRLVAEGRVAQSTTTELVAAIAGARAEGAHAAGPRPARVRGERVLTIQGLCGRRAPLDVDLELHRGQVLGLAGLVGAGRSEFLRCVYGLDPLRAGTIAQGTERWTRSDPASSIRRGIGFVSEDRKSEGVALSVSMAENLTMSRPDTVSRRGWIDRTALGRAAQRAIEAWNIRPADPWASVGSLSGGNQQKVAVARLLHQEADVLLLDEPTRGVDVAAKQAIHAAIDAACRAGKAVIVASSQFGELLSLCDSIAVFARGRLVRVVDARATDEAALLAMASGIAP